MICRLTVETLPDGLETQFRHVVSGGRCELGITQLALSQTSSLLISQRRSTVTVHCPSLEKRNLALVLLLSCAEIFLKANLRISCRMQIDDMVHLRAATINWMIANLIYSLAPETEEQRNSKNKLKTVMFKNSGNGPGVHRVSHGKEESLRCEKVGF